MGKRALETLTESMFYVLMSFLSGERCGTDIAAWVLHRTQGRVRLGPGTLYAILPKFEEEGLIRQVAVEGRKRLRRCVADAEEEEKEAGEGGETLPGRA